MILATLRPAPLAGLRIALFALGAPVALAGCNFDSLLQTSSSGPDGTDPVAAAGVVSGSVDRSPVEPAVSFSADQSVVAPGGSTTLSWNVAHADSCAASGGWSGARPPSGTELVTNLTTDDRFSLSCSGDGGTVSRSVEVQIADSPNVAFAAASPVVGRGEDALLTWDAPGADGCTAEGDWSGALAASGSMAVGPIEQDSTFTLTCTGPGGSSMSMQEVVIPEAQLSWDLPVAAFDDAEALAGFRVYVGTTSRNYDQSFEIADPDRLSYRVDSLQRGRTYYFAVTSFTDAGAESAFSNEGSKAIP